MVCKGFTNTVNAAGLAGAGLAGATRRKSRFLPQAGHWPDYAVTALLKRCPGAKVRSPGNNQHAGGADVPVMFQSREKEFPGGTVRRKSGDALAGVSAEENGEAAGLDRAGAAGEEVFIITRIGGAAGD